MRQLEVYVNEIKAGLLTEQNPGKGYTFAYSAEYVASDYPPVSLSLPKRTEAYEAENLFPFFYKHVTRRSQQKSMDGGYGTVLRTGGI